MFAAPNCCAAFVYLYKSMPVLMLSQRPSTGTARMEPAQGCGLHMLQPMQMLDLAGQLQSPILERASELLKHPQGFYVLDKILQLSSGADLLPFAAALFSRHTDVIFDKWYMRAVVKVIDRLVSDKADHHPAAF